MKVYELVIEPGREEHVTRHHVSVNEVEEVVFGQHVVYRTRQRRYGLVGQTKEGRYLLVVLAPRGHGVFGLVTARDASNADRRLYQRRLRQ